MQNTIVKEFQDHPGVFTAAFQEGPRNGETPEWVETYWSSYFLRDTVLFDEDGAESSQYKQPRTGLPFGRGFIIAPDGRVFLPYFGHQPQLVIETIHSLLGSFRRGDASTDGSIDIGDVLLILFHLFVGTPPTLPCASAADADGTGEVRTADAILLLRYLFVDGPAPPAPFPDCGSAAAADGLACERYPPCQ